MTFERPTCPIHFGLPQVTDLMAQNRNMSKFTSIKMLGRLIGNSQLLKNVVENHGMPDTFFILLASP